ncbi:MAG TPA: LPS export ABC transporter permease LptF [Methylibium sp.]|uniref:LPS export ABC transporter permease LptF n=1 Tax=Methylibium sp. TaxID=2067992 RepID=UPI002DBFE747|nr:LPS export ABC transporter permease LptF [Methylibium sp.]HEU4460163.1 LPS export ABC transporter permease LptF [Methylibium sp.]
MLFDTTLRKELGRSFGATLIVIMTIVITMFLIRTLGQAAGGSVAAQDVALLLGYLALDNLPAMLSLSLFIAIVTTMTRMYRDSEMVIWFASGVGLFRFVRPVLGLAAPLLLIVAVLALFVWPWGNRQIAELKDRYERRSDVARVAPGQFQTSADGKRVFFVERDTGEGQSARNVFVLERKAEGESLTAARSGRIEMQGDQRVVVLENGQRSELDTKNGDRRLAQFDVYRVAVGESGGSGLDNLPAKARSTWELLTQPTPRHRGELTWRIGLALGGVNLVLLGIGLAAGNPRRGGSWNLLFALLAFVVYYNVLNLSQTWVSASRLDVPSSLLLVHGGTLLLALGLLYWRDRAAAIGYAPWRRKPRKAQAS